MFKIGFMHPNGAAVTPISLSAVNWPNATAINTTTTSSGLITWAQTQSTVNLRIVSSNIQQNPFLTNGNGTFRVITNSINDPSLAGGATITTYTSLDFTITVNKNTYMWFRLGPAEVSRDVTVYNASNNDTLLDTVTITAGPFVTPIFSGQIGCSRTGGVYNYTLQTVQISNLPASPTAYVYLNWYLTSGVSLPRVFYAKNYSGITGTGSTILSGQTTTPDAFTPAFTEIVTPGSGTLISVANGDFLTFAVFKTSPYVNGSFDSATLDIYNNVSPQLIASATIKVVDQ
jgi:hypothetical protein